MATTDKHDGITPAPQDPNTPEATDAPQSHEQTSGRPEGPTDPQTPPDSPHSHHDGAAQLERLPGHSGKRANDGGTARPWTPDRRNADSSTTITMKRACNGCGQRLGDVTEQEMARGVNGLPLPDVRKECPNCGPTAPEPACRPMSTVDGDEACLDGVCDHAVEPGADYCTNTGTHTICLTHSAIGSDGEITHAEPWPCQHSKAVTA